MRELFKAFGTLVTGQYFEGYWCTPGALSGRLNLTLLSVGF